MTLDTGLILKNHGFCSYDEITAIPGLNHHTLSLLEGVTAHKFAEMFNMLDNLRSFQFSQANFYIHKPAALNAVVYDCKVHNGAVFFAVFYALDNHIAKVCQSHEFVYNTEKNLWYKNLQINPNTDINSVTSELLNSFLVDLTAFCHLLINKANLNVAYNQKLFF